MLMRRQWVDVSLSRAFQLQVLQMLSCDLADSHTLQGLMLPLHRIITTPIINSSNLETFVSITNAEAQFV